MEGTTLYPLNRLKVEKPHLWGAYATKYEGREERTTSTSVPPLNCLWNDTLFFSPVEPHKLGAALREEGFEHSLRFFEIEASRLDPASTVIMTRGLAQAKERIYAPFNPDVLAQYAEVPEFTREHYRKRFSEGQRPWLFLGIPHILYRGALDISGCRIVDA